MTTSNIKVGLVTGSTPPERCGVGDYTVELAAALSNLGVNASILTQRQWTFRDAKAVVVEARARRCDLLHLQYPTMGYGAGLAPHLLTLLSEVPTIVTLHEYSLAHFLRRTSEYVFGLAANHLVFTADYEKEAFISRLPSTARRSSVIPIGSNVPFCTEAGRRERIIVYFGHIKPNRGIEEFIDLAKLSTAANLMLGFQIIGSSPRGHDRYAAGVKAECVNHRIEVREDLDASEVATQLSKAAAAYLPFPDGASMRRGTLLAALGNGVPVITTRGPFTPAELDGVVKYARDPAEALAILQMLMTDHQLLGNLGVRGRAYAAQFDWIQIAAKHRDLYVQVISVS